MSARLLLLSSAMVLATVRPAAAGPDVNTIRFWNQCVAAVDARVQSSRATAERQIGVAPPDGEHRGDPVVERVSQVEAACEPPDGVAATVQDWRGTVIVPHTTVDALLESLRNVLPQQEDVVAAKFLARSRESVRVYLRIVRRKIITVVFDTEHQMDFDRRSPRLAFSRSVMTRVAEVADAGTTREQVRPPEDNHGFLWKLNAYSTYAQAGDDVVVTMESLTLSRDVPLLLRPIAGRIIDSIARESMVRTLEGLRRRR